MKRYIGWIVTAGIAISSGAACAQGAPIYTRGPGYAATSDFDAPYAVLPPRARYGVPVYGEPRYASPMLLPRAEVYTVLRDGGYSPLGAPQQRGYVYTISVISPDGDDGRLVIDARSGRILRFLPAYRMGGRMDDEITVSYGPAGAPRVYDRQGPPRPPGKIPRVASRTPNVPLPKSTPARAMASPTQPAASRAAQPATKPADAQASVQPVTAAAPVPATPPVVIEAKPPAPALQPTQEMPAVQGLE